MSIPCHSDSYIIKKFSRNLRVDSREDVIQNINVCPAVHCTSQSKASLLTARQVNATLSNHGHIAIGKKSEITTQAAYVNDLIIPEFVIAA